MNEIRRLLDEAHGLDLLARQRRREAGAMLARLMAETPTLDWHPTVEAMGLDTRTAEMLIRLSVGIEAA